MVTKAVNIFQFSILVNANLHLHEQSQIMLEIYVIIIKKQQSNFSIWYL
jgi:hypothetical protein